MPESLKSVQWIEAIDQHYLSEFLPAGGSSVKFAVCYPGIDQCRIGEQLRARAQKQGFLVADIDASKHKVHLIEQIFGRVADQIPWDTVVDRMLSRFARENQWMVPESFSDCGVVEQLDQANRLGMQQVSLVLQRQIGDKILLNRKLAKDFRVAMHWLARGRLDTALRGTATYQQLTDWLGGRIQRITELKPYQIFSKVSRANARHLLGSLLAMIREAGLPGLVITLNGVRLLDSQRPEDGSIHYTKAALFDAYEVFREFVDSTDAFDGLLLSVFVPPTFLDLEPRGRGIAVYPALLFRVYDELRGLSNANPLAAMARINDEAESIR